MGEQEKPALNRAADSRELVLRRDIELRPSLVCAAWADPEKRRRWWTGDSAGVTVTCDRGRRGNTQLTVRAVFASPETREAARKDGRLRLWARNLDRLQAMLAAEAQPSV